MKPFLKPCRYPGCHSLSPSGYCAAHEHKRHQPGKDYDTRRKDDPRLSQSARIRNSRRWKRVRAIVIASSPLCADPFGEHESQTVRAIDVHHIKPLASHPELAFALDNLMPLCRACHRRAETHAADSSI